MRMWAKKLVRLTAASRAACQGGSSSSSTVCQAKASRLRAASVIARNLWPWPKRLAGEDEVVAGIRDHLGDGVAGEQIVAQERGAQRRQPRAMLGEPAPDSGV